MDTIHNSKETLWEGIFPEESTYQIENFLSQEEVKFIIDWYYKKKPEKGFYLQNKQLQFVGMNSHTMIGETQGTKEVCEIVFPRIKKYFGEYKLYDELHNDVNPHSADLMCEQTRIFGPHTDAITHIPGWLTQKDIILPLWIENDAETYTYAMDQRCYMRGTHFRKGAVEKATNVYSNVLRDSYNVPGIKYLNGNEIDHDFLEKHIGPRFLKSYFEGLTVESTQENIPGNAIIKDSSVIHGPSNYNLHGASKKLNISIRMFKEVKDWRPNTVFSNINFEACNARTYYNDQNTEVTKN